MVINDLIWIIDSQSQMIRIYSVAFTVYANEAVAPTNRSCGNVILMKLTAL